MRLFKKNINFFYELALTEGEGLGTAYEYYVRSHLFSKLITKAVGCKNVLIAGLPEKYGFCLDFLCLADSIDCKVDITEDKIEAIEGLRKRIGILSADNILRVDNIQIHETKRPENPCEQGNTCYELALSAGVLQRIHPEHRVDYFRKISKKVKYLILFAPNKGNNAHPKRTGLNGFSIEDLLGYIDKSGTHPVILGSGRMDLPPFPPGVTISLKRQKFIAGKKHIRAIFMHVLSVLAKMEFFYPAWVKNKFAHVVYLIMEFKNGENY
jgi:hypothetical protein